MNTLTSKLSAFAAALAMNCLVLGSLGYLFALQAQPNVPAVAVAKTVVTSSSSVGPFVLSMHSPGIGGLKA